MSQSVIHRRTLIGAAGLVAAAPIRAWAAGKPRVAITSARGTIVVELEDKKAPITAKNFLRYVDAGAYVDGSNIYRASREKGAEPGHGTIQGQQRGDDGTCLIPLFLRWLISDAWRRISNGAACGS